MIIVMQYDTFSLSMVEVPSRSHLL
jgi:hypothetical protein